MKSNSMLLSFLLLLLKPRNVVTSPKSWSSLPSKIAAQQSNNTKPQDLQCHICHMWEHIVTSTTVYHEYLNIHNIQKSPCYAQFSDWPIVVTVEQSQWKNINENSCFCDVEDNLNHAVIFVFNRAPWRTSTPHVMKNCAILTTIYGQQLILFGYISWKKHGF